jgi:hypothetical protein
LNLFFSAEKDETAVYIKDFGRTNLVTLEHLTVKTDIFYEDF